MLLPSAAQSPSVFFLAWVLESLPMACGSQVVSAPAAGLHVLRSSFPGHPANAGRQHALGTCGPAPGRHSGPELGSPSTPTPGSQAAGPHRRRGGGERGCMSMNSQPPPGPSRTGRAAQTPHGPPWRPDTPGQHPLQGTWGPAGGGRRGCTWDLGELSLANPSFHVKIRTSRNALLTGLSDARPPGPWQSVRLPWFACPAPWDPPVPSAPAARPRHAGPSTHS